MPITTVITKPNEVFSVAASTVSYKFFQNNINESHRASPILPKLKPRSNFSISGLHSKSTDTIGIVVTDIPFDHTSTMAHSIQDRLQQAGYTGLIINTDGKSKTICDNMHNLCQQGMKAFIMVPGPLGYKRETWDYLSKLQAEGLIMVFASNEMAFYPGDVVYTDAQQATKEIVHYLVRNGHRKIAYIESPLDNVQGHMKRQLGYLEGLSVAGITLQEEYYVRSDRSLEESISSIEQMLVSSNLPTAIIGANDTIASLIIHQCYRLGLQVPSQISVVGCNDDPLAQYLSPSLTTIRLPITDIGQKAAEIILKRINQPGLPLQKFCFDYQLIVRESVAMLEGNHLLS